MSKIKGQDYVLSIKTVASPAAYEAVACLTDFEPNLSNKVIDGTSMCGTDYAVGFANSTMSIKGYNDFADTSVQTGTDLFTLALSKASFDFKIEPASLVTGSQTITGTGFISSYKQTFATDAFIGFDASVQIKGDYTQSIHS